MRHDGVRPFPVAALPILAAMAGLVPFAVFFTDHPGGQTFWILVTASTALACVAGALAGFLKPSSWAPLGALTSWGAPVAGLMLLAMKVRAGAAMMAIPLVAALVSSWAGARRGRAAAAGPLA
jgi:hypothetical protein